MAVVRFDFQADKPPAFSPAQRKLAASMVAEIAAIARPQAIQIDFDAPRSAWPFYGQLLFEVRRRLRPEIFLSITALVSCCGAEQRWLAGLPVDEIVPMAFTMGQAAPATIAMLQRAGRFPFSGCRTSIGIELPPYSEVIQPRKGQRAYFFPGPQKWTPALAAQAQESFLP